MFEQHQANENHKDALYDDLNNILQDIRQMNMIIK